MLKRPNTLTLLAISLAFGAIASSAGCAPAKERHLSERDRIMARGGPVAPGARSPDEDTVIASRHLVRGIPAKREDGIVNAVIEIPAGTTAKFEADSETGWLKQEYRDGKPRIIDFLSYPWNYGFIPSTLLAEEEGGDGDPLDVLVLGPMLERALVVRVRLVGALKLLDAGEVDDKLIAVPLGAHENSFSALEDMDQLDVRYPNVRPIIELWITGYKGPGVIVSKGWAGAADARTVLETAIASYGRHAARTERSCCDQ